MDNNEGKIYNGSTEHKNGMEKSLAQLQIKLSKQKKKKLK